MGQRQVLCVRSVKVNILAGCFLGGAGAAATPPAAAIAAALGRLMGDGRPFKPKRWALPTTAFFDTPKRLPISPVVSVAAF